MAIMAAYASAVSINTAEGVADDEGLQAAVDDIVANIDAVNGLEEVATPEGALGGEAPHVNSEADLAAAAKIDGAFDKIGGLANGKAAEERPAQPDNYRPPPVQNQQRRERRDRPNIHEHGLLKSMDLNYVSGGFDQPKPRAGPIGFLGGSSSPMG